MISKALFFTLFLIGFQALGIFAVQFKIVDIVDCYFDSKYVNLEALNSTVECVNDTSTILHVTQHFNQRLPQDSKMVIKIIGYSLITRLGSPIAEISVHPCQADDKNRKYLPKSLFKNKELGPCKKPGTYHYNITALNFDGLIDEKVMESLSAHVVLFQMLSPENKLIGESLVTSIVAQ